MHEKSKLESEQNKSNIPNIYQKLIGIGFSSDQCSKVIDLINLLPIHIKEGICNTKVSVSKDIIIVEPNDNNEK